MRRLSRILVSAAILVLLGSSVSAWGASIGVGTDTGRIKVDNELVAGGTYPLPTFRVGNTGSESMGYVLKVAPYKGGITVPAEWVTFQPDVAFLKADEWVEVQATLVIPADAAPGHYTALLAASPKLPDGMSSAKVNVGAGPRLEVDVIAASPTSAAIWKLRRWFTQAMPWSAVGIACVALTLIGLIVWLVLRRTRRNAVT